VGDGAACVGELIEPLANAPADTALLISFLDQLGNLQILVVPQVVDVVTDAVTFASDLAVAVDQQLAEYLQAAADALEEAAGSDGVSGTVDDVLGGGGDLPEVPSGTTDLPELPVPDVGGTVDDTVSGVTDVVDDVTDTVNGAVCGVLGC